MPGGQESSRHLAIHLHALGLVVGAFVPVESEPAQALQNSFDHFGGGALSIGIFNAQDQGSAAVAGEQPVEERSASPSHVQVSGWGRRKTNARMDAASELEAGAESAMREESTLDGTVSGKRRQAAAGYGQILRNP